MPPSRFRNWVFTLNNPVFPLDNPRVWAIGVQYCVWQLESGESGTPHIQGYLVYKNKKSLNQLKALHRRVHWEQRRGSHDEAKEYCLKDDGRIAEGEEFGDEPRGRGARTDLEEVRLMIVAGSKEIEIANEHFGTWCRYHRSFQVYRGLYHGDRDFQTFTTVFWGASGVGKTRRVFDMIDPQSSYWLPKPNGPRVFWDGYCGQDDVVIDEFYGWMPRIVMYRLCDRFPFRVETKGGSVPFRSKRVFITSNSCPGAWWPVVGLGAMRRRLSGELGVCYKVEEGVGEDGVMGILSEPGCGLEEIPPQVPEIPN